MPIKFVILDLGGVYFTDGTSLALERIEGISHYDKRTVDELFKEAPGKEGYLFRIGKLSSGEFWDAVSERLGISKGDASKMRETWLAAYEPRPGMKELVQQLRRNYKVVAFSNTMKERIDYLEEKYGLMKDFDAYVFSYEYGMTKRDPAFFRTMLGAINADVGDCVFVDDKDSYLDAARILGMESIKFADKESLVKDLATLGVVQ